MLIDCDSCIARGVRCASCVITVMFDSEAATEAPRRGGARLGAVTEPPEPPGGPATAGWDEQELRALGVLADAGLLAALEDVAGSVLARTAHHPSPPEQPARPQPAAPALRPARPTRYIAPQGERVRPPRRAG